MTSPLKRSARVIAAGAALALALAACSDEPEQITLPSPSPEASESAEPEPTTEPSPEDPFAVPTEIDAAYVERVLNEINRLDAEMTREILARPADEEATELPANLESTLDALYAEPIRTLNGNGVLDLLSSPDERGDLLPPDRYDQLYMDVEEVLDTEGCVLARVDRDFTTVDAEADDEESELAFVFLHRAPEANATGWQLAGLITSDAAPGSEDEEELRTYVAKDLEEFAPEVCK